MAQDKTQAQEQTKLFTLRTATGKSRATVIAELFRDHGLLLSAQRLTAYEKRGDMKYSDAVKLAAYYEVEPQDVCDYMMKD